ncbi:hypothetical protein OAX78_02545 [Planctomycetota bacterium]|nr:hypothetical protein [Planctomycetota bacterium]
MFACLGPLIRMRRNMVVPGVVNMETTQSFEEEDGRTIVRAWLASQ